MEKKKRKVIEIEPAFNDFVKEFGGELISELIGKNPNFDNADYLFRNDSVIAELKCLEKDFFRDKEYQKKIDKLYGKWVKEGLVGLFPKRTINSKDLPEKCQRDIFKIFKDPIERIVKKANKQIRETKEYFNLPEAKGVLLLANNGNYSLETEAILKLVTKIIRVQFTSINYVAYFTVNMPARLKTMDGNIYVWAMAHSEREENHSYDFLHKLGDGWIAEVEKLTGEKHTLMNAPKEITEHLKFVKG